MAIFLNKGEEMNKGCVLIGFLSLLLPGSVSPMTPVVVCKLIGPANHKKEYIDVPSIQGTVVVKLMEKGMKQVTLFGSKKKKSYFGNEMSFNMERQCLDIFNTQNKILGIEMRLKLTGLAYYLKTQQTYKDGLGVYDCIVPVEEEITDVLEGQARFLTFQNKKNQTWDTFRLSRPAPSPHGKSKSELPSFTNKDQKVH